MHRLQASDCHPGEDVNMGKGVLPCTCRNAHQAYGSSLARQFFHALSLVASHIVLSMQTSIVGVLQERELCHNDSGVATLRHSSRESNGRSESSAESHDVHEVNCWHSLDVL